jgi:hypothetical protein
MLRSQSIAWASILKLSHAPISVECVSIAAFTLKVSRAPISVECVSIAAFTLKVSQALISVECLFSTTLLPGGEQGMARVLGKYKHIAKSITAITGVKLVGTCAHFPSRRPPIRVLNSSLTS